MKWIESDNPGGWATGKRLSVDAPAPTLMHAGMGGDSLGHWHLHDDGGAERMPIANGKPTYVVPSLAAIVATPPNGLTHVSTFSGAGGTCLGFRMAGFRTLLANDCDPRAVACYRANLPSPIDERPIQSLSGAEVLRLARLAPGQLDVLEGSPPCTSFSTAGKRAAGWGRTKEHAGVVQQRIEDLFFDWLRLLGELRPRAFVAENVSGMVKGVAKGYFKLVLAEMGRLGYRTEARLLDAQWLGVPQQRQRIIFMGLRDDLGLAPSFPAPLAWRYSIRDALPWIDGVEGHNYGDVDDRATDPMMTIAADSKQQRLVARVVHDTGGSVRNKDVTDAPSPTITAGTEVGGGGVRSQFLIENAGDGDAETRTSRVPGQASSRGRKGRGSSPAPTILSSGSGFSDVQAPTVTRRKFTILEVKRLCSFPDDYDLAPAGSYAHQWARLGNSVPPLMAYYVAAALRDVLLGAAGR